MDDHKFGEPSTDYPKDPESAAIRNPISEEFAEKCLAFLAETAEPLAEWKSRRIFMEKYLKTVFSVECLASDAVSQSGKEKEAYASTVYVGAVRNLAEAVHHETLITALRTAAEAKFEAWRSINASRRAKNI